MNDRAVALLEQYDVEILRTRKGRGVILCDTDKGLLVFKEYEGNEAKLALIDRLLSRIKCQGGVSAETLVPTREGALCVRENDGTAYILKTCCEGRECNIYDRGECQEGREHSGKAAPVHGAGAPGGLSRADAVFPAAGV